MFCGPDWFVQFNRGWVHLRLVLGRPVPWWVAQWSLMTSTAKPMLNPKQAMNIRSPAIASCDGYWLPGCSTWAWEEIMMEKWVEFLSRAWKNWANQKHWAGLSQTGFQAIISLWKNRGGNQAQKKGKIYLSRCTRSLEIKKGEKIWQTWRSATQISFRGRTHCPAVGCVVHRQPPAVSPFRVGLSC